MTIYMDCNATTPMEPRVADCVLRFMTEEFGNAGSRTHPFGARAKEAVQRGRETIADVVSCMPEEIIFTSGATESNNLAILGLEQYGNKTGKKHIISTQIEHKAVIEPLETLAKRGFEISLVPPSSNGIVSSKAVEAALREDTLLVSVMHVNNETGMIQPILEIASVLEGHDAIFHTDAAQGFGKELNQLKDKRIDLVSISGHKIFGPKGIGALITRRRRYKRPPLEPLFYGGGQERGLRPGTLPVHLIVGLGEAAKIAIQEHANREEKCLAIRKEFLEAFEPLEPSINGDTNHALPHVVNISLRDLDSEAIMLELKDLVAISNGSACTSQSYQPSHVLKAMHLSESRIQGALRWSWCHLTEMPDWNLIVDRIKKLK